MIRNKITKEQLKKALPFIIIFLLLFNIYQHYEAKHRLDLPIPTVIVRSPLPFKMADYVIQTGNTVAYNAVDLVARVEGYLNEINFTDGSFVKSKTTLFVIEPEPYLEKVKAAQASLAANQAMFAYDTSEYQRQKRMYQQNATSLNNVEKWLAKSQQSKAEVDKAKADLAIAEINYSYTHVEAPFDGRIGRHLIDKNNLVGNHQATNLATIEQLDPIYVYFNLNEIDFIKLREAARAQGIDEKFLPKIPVIVTLPHHSNYRFEGKLDFVNTGLNANTGTMEFRALLPNKKYDLVPGLFVQIKIEITPLTERLTVPDYAVQYDQIGPYLLLVDASNQVVLSRVTVGTLEQGHRAILTGLKKEDVVIIDGLQNASPGNIVRPKYAEDAS